MYALQFRNWRGCIHSHTYTHTSLFYFIKHSETEAALTALCFPHANTITSNHTANTRHSAAVFRRLGCIYCCRPRKTNNLCVLWLDRVGGVLDTVPRYMARFGFGLKVGPSEREACAALSPRLACHRAQCLSWRPLVLLRVVQVSRSEFLPESAEQVWFRQYCVALIIVVFKLPMRPDALQLLLL